MDILKGLVDRRYKAVLKLAKELDDKIEGVSLSTCTTCAGNTTKYTSVGVHFWCSSDLVYSFHGYTYLTTKQLLNKIREDWTNNQ